MILSRCINGHCTSHFELRRGGMFCPICGSKTMDIKQSEFNKPKKWKRAVVKPSVKSQKLF